MPRHAKTETRTGHRSPSAARAHHAGTVTHTIDIARAPAFEVRQRLTATLIRHALALSVVAAGFWIYDVGLLIRH
jgi:hypothetical protein